MMDAACILFDTDQRRGVGVRMTVPTRVGPLRVIDIMEVMEWVDKERIGVNHLGRIKGWGRFEISVHDDRTRLVCTESLLFPWYLGGALTGWCARPILQRIFQNNLRRFQRWVEAGLGSEI
jgi:hypothetical protein